MRHHRNLFTPERSLEECLLFLATIMHRAPVGSQDWNFADKTVHQAARPKAEFGQAQLAYLRALVDKYAPDGIALDPALIPGWAVEPVPKDPPCEICGVETARQRVIAGMPSPHWLCEAHRHFLDREAAE